MYMDFEKARFNAIEQQIRPWYVDDEKILSLLQIIPREEFVEPKHRNLAFVDVELPISLAINENRYLLSPKIEARLLQNIKPFLKKNILIIGSDLGYIPAILHKLK